MLLSIDPKQPEPWLVGRVANVLRRGGVAVIPTDTVYSFACALNNAGAVDRLYEVKGITPAKRLSILVPDIATASRFTRGITNTMFRTMRRVLPGPYTFIFAASTEVPRVMLRKRRTVGIRLPDSPIVLAVLAELGEPLLTTSVRGQRDEFLLDPATIDDDLGGQVDMVVDGGLLSNEPSTVVDLSGPETVIVREGKGDIAALGL
jgi:tRNA threonylcarbamoyl adenosine modification protein (Sua5/YciO/YrdC/YwlC family)